MINILVSALFHHFTPVGGYFPYDYLLRVSAVLLVQKNVHEPMARYTLFLVSNSMLTSKSSLWNSERLILIRSLNIRKARGTFRNSSQRC